MLDVSAELLVTSRRQKLSHQPHVLGVPWSEKANFHKTSYYTYMKVVHSENICLQDSSLFHQHKPFLNILFSSQQFWRKSVSAFSQLKHKLWEFFKAEVVYLNRTPGHVKGVEGQLGKNANWVAFSKMWKWTKKTDELNLKVLEIQQALNKLEKKDQVVCSRRSFLAPPDLKVI